jgi:hypothetical protein
MYMVIMQVLDFAAFSEPEYDLPIFCANAFTSPARSIVVFYVKPQIFIENPHPCTIAIVPGSVAIAYRTSHR